MFKVDYTEEGVRTWERDEAGVTTRLDPDYRPTIYVAADDWGTLAEHRPDVEAHPTVAATAREFWRRGFRHDPEPMLRVDVTDVDSVTSVASAVSNFARPGDLRLFNVDFTREFRYCLETGCSPDPEEPLRTLELAAPETEFATDEPGLAEVTIRDPATGAGEESPSEQTVAGDPVSVFETVLDRIHNRDPDVLVLSTAEIVPALFAVAEATDLGSVELGREPGYRRLAGESTYESYGRVGHSPARYTVPGRAIVDRSNTFFYHQTNLAGCLDLVARSGKPLQELAWSSIGNVLTAMQINEAMDRDVLVPWRSFRHERFKSMATLQAADRGGLTLSPDVGMHETVSELDFSSLYPNIIVEWNISPETIRCDCHDTADVPELGYSICENEGYLGDVLAPLVEDRDAMKDELQETEDPEIRRDLEGRIDAIKWILVSCFGYQGFSNAKFGRIEAHEAINAVARDVLLTAKETLEAGGWRVVHGIVDSIWVTPRRGESQTSLSDLADTISEAVDIELEHEADYDWVAFVPLADDDAGALNKYFGRYATPRPDGTEYKYRGISVRQRSTSDWVGRVQRDLIETLDARREPKPVVDRLAGHLRRLEDGKVDPADLLIQNRVGKRLEEYSQSTRNVAALERASDLGLAKQPGQDVEYVVVDDSKSSRSRVALAHEDPDTYDAAFYRERAIRAAEAVVSPLGWRRDDIREALSGTERTGLGAFSPSEAEQ
ncbi:MAG: type B DNA-directed DNA polymerase [Halodesulfurarchaeum sp.]